MQLPTSGLTFLAPGAELPPGVRSERVLPLVADGREVELSLHPSLQGLRPSLADLYHTAQARAEGLAESLPRELVDGTDAATPSFWECYQDEFARFCLAPLLVNYQIAAQVLASAGQGGAQVIEKPTGKWWSGGGAAEAVLAARGQANVPVHLVPQAFHRRLRNLLLPSVASLLSVKRALQSYLPGDTGAAAPTLSDQPCDILFLGVGASSVPIVARLAAKLADDYGLASVVADMHLGGSTEALRRSQIPVVDAHPTLYGAAQIREAVWQWPGWWQHFKTAYSPDEGYTWMRPALLRRVLICLARDVGWGQAQLATARVILDTLHPRVVVGFHRHATVIAPLVLSAKRRGLATIYCQHGIRGPYHRTLGSLPWDKMLMFGQYSIELFSDLVAPQTHFEVTGHCLYDDVFAPMVPDVATQRRREFIGGRKYLVVIPTQTDEYQVKAAQQQWWLVGVVEAADALDAAVVLKMHPEERYPDIYQELVRRWPDTVRIVRHGQYNLSELIAAADVLVTRDSTVAYEANLRETPAITVNLSGRRDRFTLAEDGGAAGVYRYADIQPAIKELLTSEATRARLAEARGEFLRHHLGPPDGHATDRITRIIAQAAAL